MKLWKIVLLIVLITTFPFILLCNNTLSSFQQFLDSHSQSSWTPRWQLRLATVYRWTFRESAAAEAYGNFLERYPQHPDYAKIKYQRASCLETTNKKAAIQEYTEFIEWFPNHPLRNKAEKRLNRIRHGF